MHEAIQVEVVPAKPLLDILLDTGMIYNDIHIWLWNVKPGPKVTIIILTLVE